MASQKPLSVTDIHYIQNNPKKVADYIKTLEARVTALEAKAGA